MAALMVVEDEVLKERGERSSRRSGGSFFLSR